MALGARSCSAATPAFAGFRRSSQLTAPRKGSLAPPPHGLRQPPSLLNTYGCRRGLFAPQVLTRLLCHWGLPPKSEHASSRFDLSDARHFPITADQVAWLESSVYMGKQLLLDSDVFRWPTAWSCACPWWMPSC